MTQPRVRYWIEEETVRVGTTTVTSGTTTSIIMFRVFRERHGKFKTLVGESVDFHEAKDILRSQEDLDRDDYDRERVK